MGSRCSAVWSAHLFWVQRAIGSNPVTLMWYLSSRKFTRKRLSLPTRDLAPRLDCFPFADLLLRSYRSRNSRPIQTRMKNWRRKNSWIQSRFSQWSMRKAWTIRFPPNSIMNKAWKKRCDSSLHYHSQWRMNEINGMKSERWFPFHQCINEERTQILWPLSHSLFRNVIIILLYLHWRRTHSQFLGSFSVRRTDLSIWTSSSLSLSQTRRPLSPVSGHRRPRSLGFLLSGIGRVQKRRRRSIEESMSFQGSCGK